MKEKKKVQTENQERIKTPFSEMVRKFKKQKNAVVALCFIIFLIFLAFFGSKIVPYGINEYDYNAILQGPSMKHLFGTDEFGRICFPVSSVEPGFHLRSDSALLRSVQSVVPFSDFWPDITADGLILLL